MSTILSTVNTTVIPSTSPASTTTAAQQTAVATSPATAVSPTITTTNSSTVKVSAAALTVAKAATTTPTAKPMTVSDVLSANGVVPEGTVIKDTAANFNAAIKTLVGAKNVSSVIFTDTKAPTITVEKNFFKADMTDATDEDLALVKKISSNYILNITNVSAPMALALKAPTKNATLSLSVNDALVNLLPDFSAYQTLAKSKTISVINVDSSPNGLPKPNFGITAAQLKSSPELLATIKGDYDLTITGVAAADAVTVAGSADKVLKASGSQSTQSKVAIRDTSANLVKNIATLETAATAGRLTSITVSDGKALMLTEAQIKADSHFLATTFTSKANIEATAVAAADAATVQSLVNANTNLTLTKESIADTAANIQANLDNLETAVKAPAASSSSNAFTIANIGVTDKGSITVTNSTLVNDIDALKILSGKYTLNVTDISVSDALALKAPSKDATLAISVKDTAANVAANWDKLQTVAKAKTLIAITVTDTASSLLSMTAAQLKADADALKLVTGDYKLSVTGVAAADVTKTLTTKNIYSVEIKDTAANILKNLTSIQTAVTAAKIQSVTITDATNPSLSISDIFALTTTLPNVTLATGVKFNVKDTASNIIAHARDDIGDVLKNAGTVTITDKTTPNLTLADAITLKGITNLDKATKYNVTDGGSVIAAQAAITGETILSGAASVTVNKNFTIADAKAVTGIKTLAKGTVYSIADTADNILAQSGVSSDKILSGANTVTVVDTSANIIAKLDQLEVLAKAGKIADIKFTDTPSGVLNVTQDQLIKDAEAIGKIISQRTLPTLSVTKPATPAPLGPVTFELNIPQGVTNSWIVGFIPDGTKAWGRFNDQNGQPHAFITKTDGTGFVDLTPLSATGSWINGITPDGTMAWGYYQGSYQTFILRTDGTGFVDLMPQGATNPWIGGIIPDGTKVWGNYQYQNGQQHAFITKTDGTGFVDLMPQGAMCSWINGITPDGSKAWGKYQDQNRQWHTFITKTDGTGFVDPTPQGATGSLINGSTPDGSKAWGQYQDQNGQWHAFIIKTDGAGFVDLTPQGTTNSSINGVAPDGSKTWGQYQDQNGQWHAFITKTDGTGFVDPTPQGATNSSINGVTPDGSKAWGQFNGQNGQPHAFITKTDGTDFVDLTLQGATNSWISGFTPDGTMVCANCAFQNGRIHGYIINTGGTGFVDLAPHDSIYSKMGGFTPDGTKAWGQYQDQNYQIHDFIAKTDGTSFVDLTPQGAFNSALSGIMPDGRLYGTYQTADQKWHGFIVQT